MTESAEKRKIRRIVMVAGGVETLEYFAIQMAERFRELGYSVFFYQLKDEAGSARKLRKFVRTGETALVTFNFQGLEKEEGVYREGIGYVWEEYRIPCYNIAADHPYFYDDRLCDLPADYHHISIDRCQESYFREFYPEYHSQGFLPLAGTELHENQSGGEEPAGSGQRETRLGVAVLREDMAAGDGAAEREYDVLLTGNYTTVSFFEPYINWINEEYAAFYRGIIDDLIAHPHQTVEEAGIRHCEREMGKTPYDELRIAFHKMIFIDMYVRNYWRGAAVRTLVNDGIRVDVVGKGWEELDGVERPECLVIHPQTDSLACLRMISRAKVSLNVMPWFKDGAHDRVFNSILNKTVCVTDPSRYLREELSEGEGICYYELERLNGLPGIVKRLLGDPGLREEIAAAGIGKVRERHTWANRADAVDGWIKSTLQNGKQSV